MLNTTNSILYSNNGFAPNNMMIVTSLAHQVGQQQQYPSPLSSQSSTVIATSLILAVSAGATVMTFLKYVFRQHETEFSGKRLARSNKLCKSSIQLDPPEIRSWNSFKKQQNQIDEIRQSMNKSITSSHRRQNKVDINQQQQQTKEQAKENDMDHVYLNFFQFLWAFTFVGPFSYFLWKKATMILKLRVFLFDKWGWTSIKKRVSSLEEVVGKLVLEQSQVIHYVGQRIETISRMDKETNKEEKIEQKIASFLFPDFPLVDINGKFKVANHLAVDIDLDTKKMVKCNLDDESLNASEALILLWYNTIFAQHVKVHSYGNWGVNPEKAMKDVNPYYERSSIVSVIYNYFGFTSFPSFMYAWRDEGLLSKDWDPTAVEDTIAHGVKENICEHSHITELMPYSDMVKFITKTRWIFHNEFRKYRHMFPGINAEGLFAATVLHSLDHELMDWNLDDPLWLDVNDPRFGKMAEIGRVVRVGFVPQVPGYYFNRFFKGSGHPFFEAVYAKASKVNKHMADCLETCICR